MYSIEFPERESFIKALRFKNVFADSCPSEKSFKFTSAHARNSFELKLIANRIPYKIEREENGQGN